MRTVIAALQPFDVDGGDGDRGPDIGERLYLESFFATVVAYVGAAQEASNY